MLLIREYSHCLIVCSWPTSSCCVTLAGTGAGWYSCGCGWYSPDVSTADWLQTKIARDFDQAGHGVMTGCVGALDGCALKISRPRMSDVNDPNQFFNRKGFYAIVLQAICDHKRRFLFGSATESGSTHDSAAFKASGLAKVSPAPAFCNMYVCGQPCAFLN